MDGARPDAVGWGRSAGRRRGANRWPATSTTTAPSTCWPRLVPRARTWLAADTGFEALATAVSGSVAGAPGSHRRRHAGPVRYRRAARPRDGSVRAAAATTGRRSACRRSRMRATSASTRSASAARSKCGPGCCGRSSRLRGPVLHFGLGAARAIDVARVVWPNGIPQAEFEPGARQPARGRAAPQGLLPLGVRARRPRDAVRHRLPVAVAARDCGSTPRTPPASCRPRTGCGSAAISWRRWTAPTTCASPRSCGRRTSSITSRCWSWTTRRGPRCSWTSGFRPRGRRALDVHTVRGLRAVSQARDDEGRDVTALVAARDGRSVAAFAKGAYQGIARDHFVEFDLPARPPPPRACWWRRAGCIPPTAASTWRSRRAARCGRAGWRWRRRSDGRWRVVDPDIGFPAGKNKTMLMDLQAAPRRAAACGCARTSRSTGTGSRSRNASASGHARTRLAASSAELRYRGFSRDDVAARRRAGDAGLRADRQRLAALARPGGLLHALRRRAAAADRRGRSLRDHERRRRAAAAVSRAAGAAATAGGATSS